MAELVHGGHGGEHQEGPTSMAAPLASTVEALEAVTLSLLGAALGVALAIAAVDAFVRMVPAAWMLPRLHEVQVDSRVLLFAAAMAAGSTARARAGVLRRRRPPGSVDHRCVALGDVATSPGRGCG